ncbi:MAG: hypothetical protein AB1530_02150 [Candidatus Omnitrophota bacterium]
MRTISKVTKGYFRMLVAAGVSFLLWQVTASAANLLENTRDPFVSIIDLAKEEAQRTTKIDLPGVALRGIIYSDAKAVAIVNDELVMAGDNWSGYKVEDIRPDRVIFNDGMRSYELIMQQKDLDAEKAQENAKENVAEAPKVENRPQEEWQYGLPSQEKYGPGMYMPERKE